MRRTSSRGCRRADAVARPYFAMDGIAELNEALRGRYRIEREIGRGGMATVYRAIDLRHERAVAIKVMDSAFMASVGRERFLREIRVTASLAHPHLLALFDSGDTGTSLYFVMPLVEGVTLRQRLAAGQMPLADVRKIARETAEALSYAHAKGVVHRDIKPENILLAGYDATGGAAWNTLVADFGIAVLAESREEHLTGTGVSVGTPLYMSPEQAVGDPVDHRTDIWALGCVVYEMIEGAPPRGVLSFQRRGLPANVRTAVLRALAQDPNDRFETPTELANALGALGDDAGSHQGSWRSRVAWGAVAIAALAFAATSAARRPRAAVPRPLTRDSVAMRLYTIARVEQARRTASTAAETINLYSRAVERDSSFALAWAGMARAAQFALLRGFVIPGRSRDSLLAMAVRASQRAVLLDSSTAEIWLVHARVLESIDPTSRTAVLNDVRRAIALDSRDGDAWFALGRAREELLDTLGARLAYSTAIKLAPTHLELLGFLSLHGLWTGDYISGRKWADSSIVVDPTYVLGREAALLSAIESADWRSADRHALALGQMLKGRERVTVLCHSARLANQRGDRATARRLAAEAERLVDSVTLTKHESANLGEAFSAAGDTTRAVYWLAAYQPRGDLHFQLHLHRDPALSWIHGSAYKRLLLEEAKE